MNELNQFIQQAGVIADAVRFNYALVELDEEAVEPVPDVLEDCSYGELKEQLIERFSVSS